MSKKSRTIARPTNRREYVALLQSHGFEIFIDNKGGYRASHPDYPHLPPVRFSYSTSDARSFLNNMSWIKRTYGIDLRQLSS